MKGENTMKFAKDFRKIARDSLRGKWRVAVLTGFVAPLLGAGVISGSGVKFSISNNANISMNELGALITQFIMISAVVLGIYSLVLFVISGAARLGYAKFNLKLIDREDAVFSDLFSQFGRLGNGFGMNFFMGLFTFLWTLLFIIPGIIKRYSYAMTPYILAENPGMKARDAITESKQIMMGNKVRLFCLEISFIGWDILCMLPAIIAGGAVSANVLMGVKTIATPSHLIWLILCVIWVIIGSLFLYPYQEAAHAAFYREISGTSRNVEEN